MPSVPSLELNQKISSRDERYYRVIQRQGQGGNSHVYLVEAMDGPFRGVVFALKLFVRIADETRLARFQREVEFLETCQHPAIMRVYDDGEHVVSGRTQARFPFVIADYLPYTLTGALEAGLTIAERLSFALQLLSAVAYLDKHDPQIVHRDIKPENIFIRGRSCVLGDFGLMKLLGNASSDEDDRTFVIDSTGPRLPRFYRTPDLVNYCRNVGELTTKSDVFQLGLVFARMFTGENPLEPCENILDPVTLRPLSEIRGSQAQGIHARLEAMLSIEPERRPSAEELFDGWEGVFREVSYLSHQLEGKVF